MIAAPEALAILGIATILIASILGAALSARAERHSRHRFHPIRVIRSTGGHRS